MKRVVFLGAAAATLVQFTKYDLTALQTLGCEIHMVCNMQNGNLSEAALHEYNQTFPQLHWHDLPFADSAAALRRNHQAYQKLLPLLKELKPDLLHCHGTIAGQYGRRAAQELGIPVFYTAHDFRVFHGCLLAERVYFSAVERKYRKATEVFFAVCPEDAAYAKKHLNQAEVVSLPDVGLDCDKYAMPERSREVVRNELDIPQDAVVLLSVGTLRMQKRLRVIPPGDGTPAEPGTAALCDLRRRTGYAVFAETDSSAASGRACPPAGLPDGYSGYAGRCGHFLYAVPA